MKTGIELITEERQRQIEKEGWTSGHDDLNINGELAIAASIYSNTEGNRELYGADETPVGWPWDKRWWKPTPDNRIKELTKAGALIAAEIDRLQRIPHEKS